MKSLAETRPALTPEDKGWFEVEPLLAEDDKLGSKRPQPESALMRILDVWHFAEFGLAIVLLVGGILFLVGYAIYLAW